MAESPYQAPESNITPKPADNEEEHDLATFIGPKNTEYYLKRFRRMQSGSNTSWHWPAFFITSFWLLYRKMWLVALGYIIGLPIAIGILSGLLALAIGPVNATLLSYLAYGVVALVVMPIFANNMYWNRAEAKIAAINAKGLDAAGRERAIASAGGTNLWLPIVLLIVPTVGILAAIAIPAYQDYTIRAQVYEGFSLSEQPKNAIVRYYESNGEFPPDNAAAGLPAPEDLYGNYVSSVTIDGSLIIVTYGNQANATIHDHALLFGLDADALPAYNWLCASEDLEPRHVPSVCRDE